jgi:nitric oxide reductase NorE protein
MVSKVVALDASRARRQTAPGILTFIVADLTVFAMLFTGFMAERSGQVALFNRSSTALDVRLGILNMLILVTSGLCVVFAVAAARGGKARLTRGWILAGFVIGAGFGVSKLVEYGDKFAHGITMQTNDFFMYYFALTGAHFLHFLGGMGALAFIWLRSFGRAMDSDFCGKIESVGLYWHMVDLLWILIFPLLYLTGMGWRS